MKVKLKILRFNPETGSSPKWKEYLVDLDPNDRVLDALNQVKWNHDGTLSFRRSCAHGVCGSDAMMINGKNRLACKVLIKNIKTPIIVEPLRGFRVIKDLIVDMEGFFGSYRSIKPYLISKEPPPEKERLQSPKERAVFDDTTKCILCGACTTSCPSYWTNPSYLGPASIVQAHRFIFDSRDEGRLERAAVLNQQKGVWRCRTIYNCTDACPRGIEVTKAIGELKNELARNTLKAVGKDRS